jgi:hypothetical protein
MRGDIGRERRANITETMIVGSKRRGTTSKMSLDKSHGVGLEIFSNIKRSHQKNGPVI